MFILDVSVYWQAVLAHMLTSCSRYYSATTPQDDGFVTEIKAHSSTKTRTKVHKDKLSSWLLIQLPAVPFVNY